MGSAYRSHSVTTYATRTNTTVLAPSGIQGNGAAGSDILVLIFFGFNLTGVTVPAGFAQIVGSPVNNSGPFSAYVAYKVANGESGDYTVTHGSLSTQGAMFCVSGGDITATPSGTFNTGTGTTTTALAVAMSVVDGLVFFAGTGWNSYGSSSPPSGSNPTFTERIDAEEMYVATGSWSSSGSTGDKTQNPNASGVADPWTGILVKVETLAVAPITPTLVRADYSRFPKTPIREGIGAA